MVKIVNAFGDVKIGRQGEVVYQRKHGEQIRRLAAPKRAIPSQTQIDHRQLYRASLDWRSGLSLANRRYLEGYCIANGVVDSYHIPLSWSRFALKLYLQHVKFAIIVKPTLTEVEKEGKDQAYDNLADHDGQAHVYNPRWYAQTFRPAADLELTKVGFYLKRVGTASSHYWAIYETDGNGHPNGSPLAADDAYGGLPFPAFAWHEEDLAYPLLNKGQLYALVLHYGSSNPANYIAWARDQSSPTYPYGCLEYSDNGGTTWVSYPTYDFLFRIYGKWTETGGEAGLLHVRHPALLKVVQKRGGLTVREYKTLSSLDEEYLTRQVGLDVLAEDVIEATTSPGIEYPFRVP